MPNHDCAITDAELGALATGADDPDFVNADYEEPTTPRSPLQVLFFSDPDTSHEFNRHHVRGSYRDDWLWASRSTAQLQLDDPHPTRPNLPCKLVPGQKLILKDFNGIRVIGYWFVRGKPVRRPYGDRRPDGTYRVLIDVALEDCWSMMQQRTYGATYDAPAGAILADAFTRAGFDASNIDPTAGPTVKHEVVKLYPATVAEQMLTYLDWSYRFDIQTDPPTPYAGPKEAEAIRVNLEINEDNWDKIFGPNDSGQIEFELADAEDDYANEVVLTYRRKHTTGRATFQNGSNVMLGYTGDEDWVTINLADSQGGVEVEIPSTGATYRLQKNNSDNAGTNEFILSSNYEEADTVGGVDYIIKGLYGEIVRRDSAEVARRAAMRGGDGIASKVLERNDASMTYAEAATVAYFELGLFSRRYFKGHGVIPTSWHADWLLFWPGATLPINLPDSKDVVAPVRIEGMTRQELTSVQSFADGAYCPAFSNELRFTPSLHADYEQIRAILQAQRKLASVASESVTGTEFIENILAIKDCATVIDNLTEIDPSILEAEEAVTVTDWPDEPSSTEYSMTYSPGDIPVTAG